MGDHVTNNSLPGDVHFHNGMIWNSSKMRFLEGELVIRDGYIDEMIYGGKLPDSSTQGAENIDLRGGYLSPSFIDGHMHLFQWSISSQGIDLSQFNSYEEVLRGLEDVVGGRSNNKFYEKSKILFGSDLDETEFPDLDMDMVSELRRLFPDIPVVLRRVCGHKAFSNEEGLAALGLNDEEYPNGIIIDDPAMDIPWRIASDINTRRLLLADAIEKMFSLGVTGGVEILPSSMVVTFKELMNEIDQQMDLTLSIIRDDETRIRNSEIPENWAERSGYSIKNDPLPVVFEKFFLDGSIGSRTASFSFDYTDSGKKKTLISSTEMNDHLNTSKIDCLIPMVHCIGDQAIVSAIKLLEQNGKIYRIEHAEAIDERNLAKMTRGRGSLCLQPNFVRQWGGRNGLYERSLGPYYRRMNPFRKICDSGVDWCFGTDLMPPGPLYAIMGAVDHPVAEQKIDLAKAFNGFIERSRMLSSISPDPEKCFEQGARANMIYVDRNLSEVILTFFKGNCVHYDTNLEYA